MDPATRALLLDPKAQKKQAQQQRKGKETQPNEEQNKEFQPVAHLQTPAGETGSPVTSKTPQQSRIDAIPAKRTSKEPVEANTANGSQAGSGKAGDTDYTANRMIQDIYNVSERWGQARKRVKAEDDKKTSGGAFPREGRTGLGEYMKERSDNTPLSSQTVDLTLGK
ncbi:hypothetical protein KEM55_003714 [Ascosphaera atra]|nr:hypothetical protein KEM55_003714 [Ascosphaera atra]